MTDWQALNPNDFVLKGLSCGEHGLRSSLYHGGVRIGMIELDTLNVRRVFIDNPDYNAIEGNQGDMLVVQKRA